MLCLSLVDKDKGAKTALCVNKAYSLYIISILSKLLHTALDIMIFTTMYNEAQWYIKSIDPWFIFFCILATKKSSWLRVWTSVTSCIQGRHCSSSAKAPRLRLNGCCTYSACQRTHCGLDPMVDIRTGVLLWCPQQWGKHLAWKVRQACFWVTIHASKFQAPHGSGPCWEFCNPHLTQSAWGD